MQTHAFYCLPPKLDVKSSAQESTRNASSRAVTSPSGTVPQAEAGQQDTEVTAVGTASVSQERGISRV